MDEDLESLSREELIAEARRLRAGIRRHRNSNTWDLLPHHPELWRLLPEGYGVTREENLDLVRHVHVDFED